MQASQALRSCLRLEPSALAIRLHNASLSLVNSRPASQPRLSVVFDDTNKFWQLQSGCEAGFAAGKTATSCATEGSICVICGFTSEV